MPTRSGKTYTIVSTTDKPIVSTTDKPNVTSKQSISNTKNKPIVSTMDKPIVSTDDTLKMNEFTDIHLLYYASLYQKLFNEVDRRTLAIYNIENYTDDSEKQKRLSELEKIIKKMKL